MLCIWKSPTCSTVYCAISWAIMQAAALESPRFYYLGGFAKDRLDFISR
jgi:hypothetical protein